MEKHSYHLWTLFVLISIIVVCGGGYTESNQCVTSDDRPGNCIELIDCPSIVALAMRGGSPMPNYVRDKLNQEHCGFNGSLPKVCCPPIVVTSNGKRLDPFSTTVLSEFIPPPNVRSHPNFNLLPSRCGDQNDVKKNGDSSTSINDFMWKALIAHKQNGVVKFGCGGTIINNLYILTAAHCLTNLEAGKYVEGVRIGESNIQTDPDCDKDAYTRKCIPRHLDYLIEESFVHSDYDSRTRQNNIGLIRLSSRIVFNSASTNPVCLPITTRLASDNFEGKQLRIAGWGLNLVTDYNSPDYKQADTPIVDNARCATIYNRTPINITYKNMCTGGNGAQDACNSDSGGPLLYRSQVTENFFGYVQYGIVSVGPDKCGIPGSPAIYTRVGYYMDWILDRMRP